MILTLIRWRDALSVEAADLDHRPTTPELAELITTGFLLAEDDEAVLVGMEMQSGDVRPGRWRFNIPKSGITFRRDHEIGKDFCIRRP